MVTRDDRQLACGRKTTCRSTKPKAKRKVSPLRQCMIRDMELAGLVPGTQRSYISAVEGNSEGGNSEGRPLRT